MAGYTRQSTFTDGDVITAAHSNDEFDQLLAAFVNTSGHKHDGTAAEGPVIGLIGDANLATPLNKVVVDSTDNQVEFNIDVSGTSTEQLVIKDGVIEPTTDNDIDLGSSSKEFKDLYIDGVAYIDSIAMPTTTVTDILDEDTMTSDSATALATQQSIKAYVDAQLTAADLDFQGDSGGALSIDLDSETLTVAGGTGIDTTGSGNTLTIDIDSTVATLTGTQTLTNKTLTTPVISSISNTGTITLPTSTDTLVGRATTDTLTNKTLTSAVLNTGVSGTAILDEDNMASNSATQLATQQSIKAYVDAQVGGSDLDFQGDTGGALSIDLDSETMTFTGGTGIDTSGATNTLTIAIDSTVATLTGTQTLTNKTLTSPTIDLSTVTSSGDLAVTDGGTGASTASGARTNLGLVIGTDVQAYDAQLADVAGLTPTDGNFIVGDGTNFVAESGATARTSLGLGTIATQDASSVAVTGGAIDGTTIGGTTAAAGTFTTATATTFSGDLNGTINTATTAVTQTAGTSDTTVATTAFAGTAANNAAVALAIALA